MSGTPERFPGNFEKISGGEAQGWTTDRQEPDRLVTVSLRIDGRIVAQALADRPRPDVQAAGFGRGHGGFSLRIPDAFANGAEHEVSVVAGSSEAPLPGGPRLYRADASAPEVLGEGETRILGRFEGVLDGAAIGWAFDPDAPLARLDLELVIDGAPAGRFRADASRLDVAAAGYGDGFHGFAGRLPTRVYDDRPHTVHVRIAGTDIRLPGEPALLRQPRSGVAYLDRPAACIAGWATQGSDLEIRYDGGPPVRVEARRLVPGFGNESTAMAACGFRSPVPPACLDGAWHAASVRFADSDDELSGSPFEFQLRTPPVRLGLTRSSGRLVEGWAADALRPDDPVRLAVFADGVALGEVVADGVRADAPGRPAQGFAFGLPRAARRLDFALAHTPETPFASFSVGSDEARPMEADGTAPQDEARFSDPALVAAIRSAFAAFLEAPGARFDAAWYRSAYPDVFHAANGDAGAAALNDYRGRGHSEGRSPSPLFDEAWYRRRWPSVGRAIAAGLIPCGFAHYLAVGAGAGFDPVPGLDALAAEPVLAEAVRSGAADASLDASLHRTPSGPPTAEPAAPEPSLPEPPDPSPGLYGDWIARLLRQAEAGTAEAIEASDRAIRARLAAPLPAMPLVSVIMPTFNRAHTIAEAIGSVLEQSYPNWELLVCDDGSTDRTAQVVAQMADPRIRYLAFERANGAVARNRGLALARGDYIAYLDSDNLWHPSLLDAMLRALLAAPSRPCAYAGYLDTEIVGTRVALQALAVAPFDSVRLAEANFIDLNTICHHRHLYDWLGGFDETLPRVQDWDLALRYFSIFRPLHVPELLAFYRRNIAWGQVTAAAPVEDTNAVVTRKTAARLDDGHLRLDIDWPADPRLTVILGPEPEAALLAELLIHLGTDGAEITLAHAGRAPAPRPLHPADPVADLPLGPDAFASPETLAAALAPFLPREGAVLALGLPDGVIADLSRRLGRPVDGLVFDADGLGITAPGLARPFHLGTLPLPSPAEPPAPPDRPALLRLGGAEDSLPAQGDAILAPADLASGPWRRIGPTGTEPWTERGPAALARALAEADALASLAPVEDIGVLGLCLVTEAMRRGLPVTLAPSAFADPLIAVGAVAGLGAEPSAAAHPSAAGGGRTHGLAFHAELTAERLRFYLYRRCFEGDR
ncbi:glycosyltransferase family A protein [Methylobacterium sp. Leaf456]|uniref:glycosyltransferase family 2 protein n=1 Tax=Methylobacterium sp. Leaf456 TaxID=1736382 RepID=UPI0012E34236|nr:glycosyltransferase family A protein [Methylobacterium sp. Leaf456]